MSAGERPGRLIEADVVDLAGDNRPWFVVCSHNGRETFAKANLERQGFEVYLPMHTALRRDKSRRGFETVSRPFLPGYLFVRLTADVGRWRAVFSTLGVRRVICSKSGPVAVRHKFIQSLQVQEVEGLLQLGVAMQPKRVGVGDLVSVLDQLVSGIVVEVVDAKRVEILTKWLGGDRRVTVDVAKLVAEPAGKPSA